MNSLRQLLDFGRLCVLIIATIPLLFVSIPNQAFGKTINYRLKWLINTSVAGDIYAAEYDYFNNVGLQVKVKPGGPERDAIRELELGYAQFGVASADQVIRATAKGAKIIVIAQLFQTNPMQWIYRSDEVRLTSLADLKGKNVGITYGGNDETIMRALLAAGKISADDVTLSSVRYDYTPFFRRKVEIWPVYRNTQGIFLRNELAKAGEKVDFFNPAEFGIQFVANSVITTEQMVEKEPELVEKFRQALLAGWEAALDPNNVQKTIAAIAQHDKDSTREMIQEQLDATRVLIKPSPNFTIGKIDSISWNQTEKIMLAQELIKAPVNIESRLLVK